ncbi:hypothetical protein RQM47_16395 [Rubrivirga sp. S365]|uniref:hypothetical protein n=1 Tax=Rubrivirga sp. S365 TaxID=3076080 RepID=UPI0028C93AFB|nr:hypothetical protein [Rubrivirga sp. S365]MDT7858230.1 hypothetical protein [Rubrivirga sp. S365]
MPPSPLSPPLPAPRLRVLEVADGDPAFAAALRGMMWDAYVRAGRPLGPSEDDMFTWWSYGRATTVQ